MVVRRARPGEGQRVAALVDASWRATYAGILPDSVVDGRSISDDAGLVEYAIAAGVGGAGVLVAEVGDDLVGTAIVGPADEEGAMLLHMLYVAPDRPGTGIGTALWEATVEEVRAGGASLLLAEVLVGNERARRFFTGRGMAPLATAPQEWFGEAVEVVRLGMSP